LNASFVGSLAVNGSTVFARAGNDYRVIRSTDSGFTWTIVDSLADYHIRTLASNGSIVVVGTDGPVLVSGASPVLRSTDNGASWTIIGNAVVGHCLAMNDAYIFVGSQYAPIGALRCPIDGSAWTELPIEPAVFTLAANGSDIFAGTMLRGVFHSSDNGTHWTAAESGLDVYAVFVALAVNGSNVFAGTAARPDLGNIHSQGIFRSTDDGVSWTSVDVGVTQPNTSGLAIHDSIVLAGTDSSGIFLSTDNGTTWTGFNTGLPNPYVSSLALNDRYIYAGILGGIWRRPLSDLVVTVPFPGGNVPLRFNLGQNFPNPFNPTTSIGYDLPVNSFVTLKIYDVLGREVQTLVNERQNPGNHSVTFTASKLPSGVYFYRLQAGSYSAAKKLLLLK
jgi:photosystem II stability/assembly factor-like uncharacterized protein